MVDFGLRCPHHAISSGKVMPCGTLARAVTAEARPRWLVIAPMVSRSGNPALAHSMGMMVRLRSYPVTGR